MTIGRPQMDKQIRGYNQGGIAGLPYVDSVANFENPLLAGNPSLNVPKPPSMNSMLPTRPLPVAPLKPYSALDDLDDLAGEREDVMPPRATAAQIKDLEEEVKDSEDSRKTFDDRFNDYKSKLAPLFGAAPRRRNFYDLASTLGEAILSSDPTLGPMSGIGKGLIAFNKATRKEADEARTIQRQIALKAFEMAREDETMAAEYLQKAQLELIKQSNKGTKFIAWEIPELDESGNPTGKKIRRSAAETDLATQQEYQNLGGYPVTGGGTSVSVGGQSTSGFVKEQGKLFSKAVAEWGKQAELARSQKNLLDTAARLSKNLDANDRGRLASVTLPLREFMVDLGWADAETVEAQQLVKSFGTRIAMGLIGQTKGAISNAEMTLFLASSPGLAMTKGGYDRLIGYLNRINQKSIDFQEAYNDAMLSGEFNEAFDSGNDAMISAAIGKWQAQWHKDNPLFSQQELPEFEALAKEESREARLLRQNFNSGSGKESGNENDVSGRF